MLGSRNAAGSVSVLVIQIPGKSVGAGKSKDRTGREVRECESAGVRKCGSAFGPVWIRGSMREAGPAGPHPGAARRSLSQNSLGEGRARFARNSFGAPSTGRGEAC